MANWKTSGKFRMKIKQQKKHGFASRVMRKAGPIRPNDLWENTNNNNFRPRKSSSFKDQNQNQNQNRYQGNRQERQYGRYVIRGLTKRSARDPTSSFYHQSSEQPRKRPSLDRDQDLFIGHGRHDPFVGLNRSLMNKSNQEHTKSMSGVRRELTYSPKGLSRRAPTSMKRHHTTRAILPNTVGRRLARPSQAHPRIDSRQLGSFTTRPLTQAHEKHFVQPSAPHFSSLNHILPSDPRNTIGRQYNHQPSDRMPHSKYDMNMYLEPQQQPPREWQQHQLPEYYPAAENNRPVFPNSGYNDMYDSSGPPPSFQEQQRQTLPPYDYYLPGSENHETEFPFSEQDPAYYSEFARLPLSTSPQQQQQPLLLLRRRRQQQQQENYPMADFALANHHYGNPKSLSQPNFDGMDGIFGSRDGNGRQNHDEQEIYPPEDNSITLGQRCNGHNLFDDPEGNLHDPLGSQQPNFHHQGEQKAFFQSTTDIGANGNNNNNNNNEILLGDDQYLALEQENFANIFEHDFDFLGTYHNRSDNNYNDTRLEDDQHQRNDQSWNQKGSADAPSGFLATEDFGLGVDHESNGCSAPLLGNDQCQQFENCFEDNFLGNKTYPENIGSPVPNPPNMYYHFDDNVGGPDDRMHTTKPFVEKMSEIAVKQDNEDQISSLTPTSFN